MGSTSVIAYKWCADRKNISAILEKSGIEVVGVGPIISQLIKDGLITLTS